MSPLYRLIVFLGWLAPLGSWASQPFTPVSSDIPQFALDHDIWYLTDSAHQLTIGKVLQPQTAALFQPNLSPVPNFGYISGNHTTQAIWLRFKLHNASAQHLKLFCEVDFWAFDELQFFVTNGRQVRWISPTYGWQTPIEKKLVYHRNYWFPFTLLKDEDLTCFVRLVKRRGVQVVPISIRQQNTLDGYILRDYAFWGGVFAVFLFVMLISCFFYLTTFDRIYWKYILCVLGLGGYFFINDGFLNQFLFEGQFWMPNRNIYFLFPLLLFYFQLLFVRSFLILRKTTGRLWHHVGTVAMIGGTFCLLSLLMERVTTVAPLLELILLRLFVVFYWLPMPLIWVFIIVNLIQHFRVKEAWLYLVAITPFYALNLLVILGNFRVIPTYWFSERYENVALAALFEVVVLTFGLAYRYKLIRDRNEQLNHERAKQQRLVYEAQVQALQLKNESLQEKERIARDLHDNVGAQLSFIVTSLQQIGRQTDIQPVLNGRQWAGQIRSIVDYTREGIKMLRETIWAIHQESFTLEEFEDRVNHYVSRYFRQFENLQVHILTEGELAQPLKSMQALNMFRIVQEALHNVVKHAQATEVRVLLRAEPNGSFRLSVSDNGNGLSWKTDDLPEHHYGLQNMKKRAEELGGQFRIYSNHGTVVEVAV